MNIITLDSTRLGYGRVVLSNPFHTAIPAGITTVYGKNGSGKTTLGTILEKGRYAYGNRLSFAPGVDKVKMLSFTDIHTLSGMEVQYYAQRLEATTNDMVPTVAEIMGHKISNPLYAELCRSLNLRDVNDKKINHLSSGELRKLLITNTLLDRPDLLILDNPYIGLDAASRIEFDTTMTNLREQGTSVILLLCDPADIPDYTDSLIVMENLSISDAISDHEAILKVKHIVCESDFEPQLLPAAPARDHSFDTVFAIRKGHIRYGDRVILRDLDWEVKYGERWVLTGPNGSGKSLLLSIVCADHPQAYANDITLFDRKRGTGESIWEIKDRIGYVSPEMQLFFRSGSTVRDIVLQGLRSAMNRYGAPKAEEIEQTDEWLRLLRICHLADRNFSDLSTGEQRLVLVARAMIKQPLLLVLDEPLHGLDASSKLRIRSLVDALITRNGTSLIFVTHYTSEIPDCATLTKTLTKI